MGPEQVLRAADRLIFALAIVGASSIASASPHSSRPPLNLQLAEAPAAVAAHDRIVILDLGGPAAARKALAAALAGAGLELAAGDGLDEALAGRTIDRDAGTTARALAAATTAFGALDCAATITAAEQVIAADAARQAAGLPVPELARAYAYELACADRGGEVDAAMRAATMLRALGAEHAAGAAIPPAMWAKYPDLDATSNRATVAVDVAADAPDAVVWIDHAQVGRAPLHALLPDGIHEIAVAAAGSRRGAQQVTVAGKPIAITVTTADQTGPYKSIAEHVKAWREQGHVPVAGEIAALLVDTDAHIAIVRRDDDAIVWTRFARSEPPHLASGDQLMHPSAPGPIVALVQDRVTAFTSHAPDPDAPLLVESPADREGRDGGSHEAPTKWWIYATIGAALVLGTVVIIAHDEASDTQHIDVHYP
jgi:hypothetical protein